MRGRLWRRLLCGALTMALLLIALPASAKVTRYAVVFGNNRGASPDAPLRYAEEDATRIGEVLKELGGFAPENLVVLRGETAPTVERALSAMSERARTEAGTEAVFFVYYSGHGDAESLHLSGTFLAVAHLEQIVRGLPARLRILALDACRSGALTRVKGGRIAPPIPIHEEETLPTEGALFLTSSSENEDAQESDELRASFFTHYFVSGLLGVADSNHDGVVTIDEAYAYAYDNTLRASSRTRFGLQHPTFEYDVRGHHEFALTILAIDAGQRARATFPSGKDYVVFEGGEGGRVVAEVGARDTVRTMSLRAGAYFVRGRGPDYLLEGRLQLPPGGETAVQDAGFRRLDYARLVRKGSRETRVSQGPEVGYRIRSPLWAGATACQGAAIGYAIALRDITLSPRIGVCRGAFTNETIHAFTDEYDLALRAIRAFDLPVITLGLGVEVGASLLRETFRTDGVAPARDSGAASAAIVLSVSRDLGGGFYVMLDGTAQTYFFREEPGVPTAASHTALAARFAGRSALVVGKQW